MPRRSGRTSTANTQHVSVQEASPQPALHDDHLALLRRQWKWAAFSQFLATFAPLLNMPDFVLTDLENDLVYGAQKVVPSIMQRLLYTLSYDKKISRDNWQSALRKQYLKRDPLANPMGVEPSKDYVKSESREISPHNLETENKITEDSEGTSKESVPKEEQQTEPSILTSENSRATTREAEFPSEERPADTQSSVNWFDLPMLTKLDSLHLLSEWQFQNPLRLRMFMKSDDDYGAWRHEPIGYDSKRNAYWLIGGDRLWIQRQPPKPPRPLKRKRPAEKANNSKANERAASLKRPRIKLAPKKTRTRTEPEDTPQRERQSRAAKLQAQMRLDAQAKELAELNRQAEVAETRRSSRIAKTPTKTPVRPMGTRISARLRGSQTNEWQPIPEEWLNKDSDTSDNEKEKSQRSRSKNSIDPPLTQDDSDSELTELSDDSDNESTASFPKIEIKLSKETESPEPQNVEEQSKNSDFVEWETICVTLEEWEHIAERFENATHYLEKALYKYLTTEIVPLITEALREIERKRKLEEAIVHRKRSSRIAIKESEREEARLAAQREAEEREKMSRARRLEARRQREEEERLRREQAREQRRLEREAKELRRQAESTEKEDEQKADTNVSLGTQPAEPVPLLTKARKTAKPQESKKRSSKSNLNGKSRDVKNGDWELDCEICHKRGVNLDDNSPMMSCGKCFKWQHIQCHDAADARAGRTRRNWDVVEFVCQQCRSRMFAHNDTFSSSMRGPQYFQQHARSLTTRSSDLHSSHYPIYLQQNPSAPTYSSPPISNVYHTTGPSYSNFVQPPADNHIARSSDQTYLSNRPYLPVHQYNHQPPIAFNHYQPREGGFASTVKGQPPYSSGHPDMYNQPYASVQHMPYSDLRSSTNQRSTVPVAPGAQGVWNVSTPTSMTRYANPYQSLLHAPVTNHATMRPENEPQAMKIETNSNISQPAYSSTHFRYQPTT